MICELCGTPTPRKVNNQRYCKNCAREEENRRAREMYKQKYRNRGEVYKVKNGHRTIEVIFPDVALPDYWTRTEYERYKKDLPKDAKVIFR